MSAEEASVKGFGLEEIDAILHKAGIILPQTALDDACNVLTLLRDPSQRKRVLFYSPVFTKVLKQTYD